MSDDPYDDPGFKAFERDIKAKLIPKLADSNVTLSLVSEGNTDVKFAVELGLSIMMDKSIVAVIMPGVSVPEKLIRVADEIVELAGTPETWHTDKRNPLRIKAALDRMALKKKVRDSIEEQDRGDG